MRRFILLLGALLVIPGIFAVRQGSGIVTPASWTASDNIYTWWVRPLAAVYGGELYYGGVSRAGAQKVNKVASDGSLSSFTLATHEADDHDAPSVIRVPNGKILAMYTRHNLDSTIRYRISSSANDISAFAAEATLTGSSFVSYTQTWVDSADRIHLLYRVGNDSWAHRYSDNNASTWSSEKIILDSGSDQIYIGSTLYGGSTIRVAIAGNPISAVDKNLYYAEIDTITGDMASPGGASQVNLYDGSAAAAPSDFEVAFTPASNVRLLDIGSASDPQILFTTFSTTLNAEYREARRTGGSWAATTVVDAGSPIENPVGGNYYFAGMAATSDVNSIYVIREDATTRNWPMERYTYSGSWSVAETVLTGDWRLYAENYRPIVPYNANASFPVISLRGEYQVYVDEFATDIVLDPSGEPTYSATVLHSNAFTGTPGGAISGWTMLAKSAGVTGETITYQNTADYFGGKYGQLFHTGGLAVLWGVTGSSAQNVELRVDGRINKTNGAIGLIARWVDANNRIVCFVNYFTGNLEIIERVAGVSATTSTAFTGVTNTDGAELRLVVNGTSATAYLYRNGVQLATVNRTLTAAPAAGIYGLASSVAASGTNVTTQLQRFLVNTP
jgi:hypothetical protein